MWPSNALAKARVAASRRHLARDFTHREGAHQFGDQGIEPLLAPPLPLTVILPLYVTPSAH
jgi:hypothetical protein